jgi:predicted SAM-dependent methyltransferase
MAHFIEIIEVRPRHHMSVTDIRFPDNSIDVVLCNHMLEHTPDDLKAMGELYRVMRPGGFGITQVPINERSDVILEDMTLTEAEMASQYGSPHRVRYYSEAGLVSRPASVGFAVEVNQLVKSLDCTRFRLMPTEGLYIVRKETAAR